MKVIYNKKHEFKLFGIKLFELKTQYFERSSEKEDDENDFFIELQERQLKFNR